MAQEILDISYVKEKSILNNNIDWNILKPIIIKIQDLKLKPLLGTDLYNQILIQVIPADPLADPLTYPALTANNKILVDNYILPFLHWYLVAQCCVPLLFKFMNKGIMTRSSENSQPISLDELKFIESRYTLDAQEYGEAMVLYLKANTTLYAAYTTNNGIDKIQPARSGINIGWAGLDEPNYWCSRCNNYRCIC